MWTNVEWQNKKDGYPDWISFFYFIELSLCLPLILTSFVLLMCRQMWSGFPNNQLNLSLPNYLLSVIT